MFCPRAMCSLLGVSFCALIVGCADQPPSTISQSPPTEPTLIANARTSVISADVNAPLMRPLTVEEIISLSIRGVRDDVIIDHLQHSSSIFHISAEQEIHLRDAGVSEDVIRAMKATAS